MTDYFPFELGNEEQYTITVDLESDKLYPKYSDFFEHFGYEGNGECWQGHIIQILEKEDPGLLHQIEFDSEGSAFYAVAQDEETQIKFVTILAPIFSDLDKLGEWVSQADGERIDD